MYVRLFFSFSRYKRELVCVEHRSSPQCDDGIGILKGENVLPIKVEPRMYARLFF
jgi:hypothetical protein